MTPNPPLKNFLHVPYQTLTIQNLNSRSDFHIGSRLKPIVERVIHRVKRVNVDLLR